MTRKIVFPLIVVSVVVLAVFFAVSSPDEVENESSTHQSQQQVNADSPTTSDPAITTGQESELTEKQAQYVAIGNQIKRRYAGRLDNVYWRVKLVNDLMQLFKKQYPNNWLAELEAFIKHAFPDIAEDLLEKLYALLEYNDWLASLKSTMKFSSLKERQAALWDKRVALFGDDAYIIWEAALKNEQLQDKLAEVDEYIGSFDEKAQLYRDSMREVFGSEVIGEDAPHKTQVMTKFLDLDSVQAQLHGMPEDKRYQELREFRESMGMDEEALQRWDALDEERRQIWSNAELYMTERANLEAQYQGDELKQKIHQLQNDVFGETEAKYIRNEEESGYFRFEKPQKYGIN